MTDRKQQILDVAQDLLLLRGFSAFSYQDISTQLGITKASIHHHFPSKEDLGVALCDRFQQQHASLATECDARGLSAREMFGCFLDQGSQLAAAGQRCCPAGVLQAEYNALPERMRASVRELTKGVHDCVTTMLERGRAEGSLAFEGSPTDQAWLLLSILQGGQLNARVHGASVYESVVRQLRTAILP